MLTRPHITMRLGLVLTAILASGCSQMPWSTESAGHALSPADFGSAPTGAQARSSPAAAPVAVGPSTPVATTVADNPTTSAPAAPAAASGQPPISPELKKELDKIQPPSITAAPVKPGSDFTVNAMIGQVNGRPIYASQVLQILEPELKAMADEVARGKKSRGDFQRDLTMALAGRLNQIVFDALFQGEAEARLTDQERFQLKVMTHLNRQELIRRYGAGSEPAANEEIKAKTGRSLDETVEGIRQSILLRKYLDEVIYSKIAVSKRDVERFYNKPENYDKYNPKPGRKVRLIMVRSKAGAEKVEAMFKEGKTFAQIAADEVNQHYPNTAGMMTVKDKNGKDTEMLLGEEGWGPPPLKEAMAKLQPGQQSPRVTVPTQFGATYWWISYEEKVQAARRSLPEVQLEIEQQIRGLHYMMIEQRYRKKLFEDAGYTIQGSTTNPLGDMVESLVKIAMGLYAKG